MGFQRQFVINKEIVKIIFKNIWWFFDLQENDIKFKAFYGLKNAKSKLKTFNVF